MEYGNGNPYQTPPIVATLPTEEEILVGPPYKLFSIGAVLWATFLGSWFAGCGILALNYWRMGRTVSAWLVVLAGLAATAFLFVIADQLPDSAPTLLFILVQLVVMSFAANILQGKMLAQHVRNLGEFTSNWAAAGLGLLACIPLVGLVLAYALFAEAGLGTQFVVSDKEEIYFAAPAAKIDAQRLARWLQDEEFFDGTTESTVLLAKTGDKYSISFCVGDGAWDDSQIVEYYRGIGRRLADDLFGRPLDIGFVDEYLEPRKTITIGEES